MLHFLLGSSAHQALTTLTLSAAESRDSTLLQTWARIGGLSCYLCCCCCPCILVWGWWTSENIKSRKNKLCTFPGLPNTALCGLCRRKSRFHRFHLSWPAPASTLLTPSCLPLARAALSCRMHTGGKCCVFIPNHHHHFLLICPFSAPLQVLWLHFWYSQTRAGAGVEQKLANWPHWADRAAGVDHITWLWMQRVPQCNFWWVMWVTSLLEQSFRVFQAVSPSEVRKYRLQP